MHHFRRVKRELQREVAAGRVADDVGPLDAESADDRTQMAACRERLTGPLSRLLPAQPGR